MPSRTRFITFVSLIQATLFLAHFFLYETWTFSSGASGALSGFGLKLGLGLLSVSFVGSSLLTFRYHNAVVRGLYKVAAVWLGLLSFLLFGAIGAWIIYAAGMLAGLHV